MAATIITDTHLFVTELVNAGMEQKQAEALAQQFSTNLVELATKEDLDRQSDKLTIRMGAMLVIAVAAITALDKLIA